MKKIDINKPEQDAKRHPDRKRTILRGRAIRGFSNEYVPALHLTGLWMLRAGFGPGDKVTIVVSSGMLGIYRNKV